MGVVECAAHPVEIGKQEVAVDERVERFHAGGLLEPTDRVPRGREERPPAAAAQHADRRARAVAFWTGPYIESSLDAPVRRDDEAPPHGVRG